MKASLFDLALAKPHHHSVWCFVLFFYCASVTVRGLSSHFSYQYCPIVNHYCGGSSPTCLTELSFLSVHLKTWIQSKNQCMYGCKCKFIILMENDLLHPLSKARVVVLEKMLSDKLLKKKSYLDSNWKYIKMSFFFPFRLI